MKPPLLSLCLIVKPDAEEAKLLDRALWSVKHEVDEICVTITGDSKECEDVCAKYKAKVSRFEWIDDFSAARNFNFAQATGDYILWMDADDVIVGAKNLRRICKLMRKNLVHATGAWYLYGFDKWGNCTTKHKKIRIVKNEPGLYSWGTHMNELHEDLVATRAVTQAMVDQSDPKHYFEVHHLSNDERFGKNAERNVRISKKQVEKYPNDPRAYWNLGNSLITSGDRKGAIGTLNKFVSMSASDDEKYLALVRLAHLQDELGDPEEAVRLANRASSIFPWYPDAWITLGTLMHKSRKFVHAKEYLIQGMAKAVPENIIVYDPKGYTAHPMRLLADCYFNLGKAKDALRVVNKIVEMFPKDEDSVRLQAVLEKECAEEALVDAFVEKSKTLTRAELAVELESLPDDRKSHPAVCVIRNEHFKRDSTTGKQVDFYCGFTAEQWGRDSEKTGIGGSEESVLNLSKQFAKNGYDVTVYANCGHVEKTDEFGVRWRPFYMFNVRDKFDTLVIWRHPKLADYHLRARTVLVDMHDVVSDKEFTAERLARITKVLVKSKFHRSLFPSVPDSKIAIISNGIDLTHFDEPQERKKASMIYTSSPDRGLEHLLDMWDDVKEAVPDAELNVYYGWAVFDNTHGDDAQKMEWKKNLLAKMAKPGIIQHGRVGHREIAKRMQASDVFAYPCHFEEIDCISMKKAMAAGAIPVTTDYAAMGEYEHNMFSSEKDDWDRYKTNLISALKMPKKDAQRTVNAVYAKRWSWEEIAKQWIKHL